MTGFDQTYGRIVVGADDGIRVFLSVFFTVGKDVVERGLSAIMPECAVVDLVLIEGNAVRFERSAVRIDPRLGKGTLFKTGQMIDVLAVMLFDNMVDESCE